MILHANPNCAPDIRRVMTSEQIDIGRLCADNAMISSQQHAFRACVKN
jgi:hypothetical protein